ncbi:MAG: hypothetical protein AB1393_06095 [Candidatus Edwardsbacteria bacterium]
MFYARNKIIAVLCAFLMLAMPFELLAQEATTACMQAESDAQRDVNGTTWFALGCLFGAVVLVVAMVSEPSPKATMLLGKSPEYIAAYTDCYRHKAKSIKQNNALYGCLLGTGLSVAAYAILIAAASTE